MNDTPVHTSNAQSSSFDRGSTADPGLIRFDRKTWTFLALLVLGLIIATTFKLHGSSVGMWNTRITGQEKKLGIVIGTPRAVRADEWSGTTLQMISQAESNPPFPVTNPAWGPAEVPLISNLPVRHWSTLFRPQYWGFFVLGLEHAFAFYWGMKACLLVGGMFLLLMLLTGNDFWISLLGATWVFFSGFIQWWYSTPSMLPEMIGCVALLLVAIHYLVLSPYRWTVAASALVFLVCLLNSVLCFYPPFQVPLLYLGIAILVGSIGPRLPAILKHDGLAFRICAMGVALLAIAVLGVAYYRDAQQAIAVARGTVYPGARMVSGGELSVGRVFSGFYGFFMRQDRYPHQWGNVCEASNFVLLFPVPATALLYAIRRKLPLTALDWSLITYLTALLVWLTIGWPYDLAVVSGFGLSWGPRSLVGLGLGSILLCCTYLAKKRIDVPASLNQKLIIAVAMITVLVVFSWEFNRISDPFASLLDVWAVCIVMGAAGYFLLARRRVAFAACILIPSVWSFGQVNPIAIGLNPILQAKPLQQVSQIIREDKGARWAVYGSLNFADMFKAAGAQVFNGTKLLPPLDDLRILDPTSAAMPIYNRYAHIELTPTPGPAATFKLIVNDHYSIAIDPSSDLWRQAGIRYVALPFLDTDPAFLKIAALVTVLPEAKLWVYKYQWKTDRLSAQEVDNQHSPRSMQ